MNPRFRSVVLCCSLALLVAACNKAADESAAESGLGEVLPGSISDAMIDLDTSTASPPMVAVREPAKKAASPSSSSAAAEVKPAAETAEQDPAGSTDTE